MRTYLLLLVILLSITVTQGEVLRFAASLTGNQVVPAVNSNGSGAASFTFDESDRKLFYTISIQGLTGITAVNLHAPGAPGATGPVIENLRKPDGGAAATGSVTLEKDQIQYLTSGRMYIQVHTTANPEGEIRGQIITTINEFIANLKASHIIPSGSVSSSASGFADFDFDPNTRTLSWKIEHDVNRPTAAHIHGPADRSTNGPVILVLNTPNSPIRGSAALTDAQVTFLKTGLLYVKIHSEQFTDGEIRGQILIEPSSSGYDGFETTLVTGLVLSSVAVAALVVLGAFGFWRHRQANVVRPAVDA